MKHKKLRSIRKYAFYYLLLLPALVLFSIFRLQPVIAGFILSFQKFEIFKHNQWIGLENYQKLFSNIIFQESLRTTVIFTVIAVPVMIVAALGLALLVNVKGVRFTGFFKACFFLPYVSSGVVVSIVWKWFMNESFGLLNVILKSFGLHPLGWLTDIHLALFSIMFVAIWMECGFYMLIFLSNLELIPQDLYEAAAMDGANSFQQFVYITINQLRPAFTLNTILCTLNFFRTFTLVFTMTGGGPLNRTELLSFHIYKLAFQNLEFGQAAAGMIIMLLIVSFVLVAQFKMTEVKE